MRLIFHNPHHHQWFGTPVNFPGNRKGMQKYRFMIDYFQNKNQLLYVYLDKYKKQNLFWLLSRVSFYIWALKNKLNIFNIRIITDIKKIETDDILFIMLYGTFTNENGQLSKERIQSNLLIKKCKAYKVVHLTHYMYHVQLGSNSCRNSGISLLVAENNLKKNSNFFKKYYTWYSKDVYLLPFMPGTKFKKHKKFQDRICKAVATGTIPSKMNDQNFLEFFETPYIHPMRVEIFKNQDKYPDLIDSYISSVEDNIFSKKNISQDKYFNFDIVEIYNSYKMFIVPEEISGLPGIGFVEGMRAGSVFIGIDNPMYLDIGLINGKNYISYDGTLMGLTQKIKYYQEHVDELELIASNSYEYSKNYLQEDLIMNKLLNYLSCNKSK